MGAIDTLERISNTALATADLRYCLVDERKHPYRWDGKPARPNEVNDFCELSKLLESDLQNYAGIGISVQASKVCAIDVDHCFSKAWDINSADTRANDILGRFSDKAYCEFSFSGTGLRVIFKHHIIEDYSLSYYIKNEKFGIEYYQPTKSFRYVTVTGNSLHNNDIDEIHDFTEPVQAFLDKYMKKPERKQYSTKTFANETRSFDDLMKLVRIHYFRNPQFQDLWFGKAPGSGKDESERDYHIVAYLYENITQDKTFIKLIFEQSPFFKSKDGKHVFKWTNQNGRYFEYVYEQVRRTHE